ncbi:MAG: glycosyltransferase family 4 protein [Sphingobacteriales bacterium]|nr:MAG: glycosyltransferase family 4 protein [Sphingobacteriales bacterium]
MSSKTIAVNTRFLLSKRLEGIGRFTCETLQRIAIKHPEHRFVFLFDRPYSKEFIFSDNVLPIVVYPPARHPLLWYMWFEWAVPRVLKQVKADVFLSTDGYCSLRSEIKTAMVIHDIAFEHYPDQIPLFARKFYQHFSPRYARRADSIAAVSEYTKQDLVNTYQLPASKIEVVYNGVNRIYRPLSEPAKEAVKEQYTQGKEYFLFVGAIHPRKNLARILSAFDRLKSQGNCGAKFLVAGRQAWQCKEALDTYEAMQHKDSVIFLGHLQIDELSKIMGAAIALVYASVFEGFGIPIVEAFCAETPVITGNTSSMPEVAGNAALLVNPFSVESIYLALAQLYYNVPLRSEMIEKGRFQKTKFDWDISAENLWNCVEKLF